MKTFLTILLFSFLGIDCCNAQFYYRDILSNNQLFIEMAQMKEKKIRTIAIKSFEDDGSESDGFYCEKTLSKSYRKSEIFTRSNVSGASLFTSLFNDKGFLLETSDSSATVVSKNRYQYDDMNRIKKIRSMVRSSDDDFVNEISEEHIYYYSEALIPEKMIRVKNFNDSITILFSTDENNNISIEKDTKTGSKYYYYYDKKNRLTDIVHASEYTEKMIPDYQFEYNTSNQITQMVTVEEGSNNYFIWKYTYNDGLRTKERCFSKEKRLLGSIEYNYK